MVLRSEKRCAVTEVRFPPVVQERALDGAGGQEGHTIERVHLEAGIPQLAVAAADDHPPVYIGIDQLELVTERRKRRDRFCLALLNRRQQGLDRAR